MKRYIYLLVSVALVLSVLAGCAPKATPTPQPQPTKAQPTAVAPTAVPPTAVPTPTPKKVALLMPGRIDDMGWNQRGYEGLMQLKSKYGAEVKYVELVPIADYERYVRQFVQQGYDLIIGHDFMAQDAIFKVAAEYPKLWFAWAGYPVESTNVVPYSVLAQEAAYLTGILAAGMSKTGVIGAMGGFEVPDVVRDIEGFKMGAKAYNPNIKVMVTFTNDWQDPVKGKDTALSLISAGADVIHSDGNPMSLGLFEAAKEKKVYVIGSIGDQYPLSPETVLTSEIYGFPMIFDTIYSGMIKGTLKPEFLGPSLKDGGADLAPYHSFESVIPKELKDRIEQTKQDILSGKLVVPAIDKLSTGPAATLTLKKVALLMPGRIDDMGWNQRGYEGLMQLKSKYGAEVKYVELVPIADYERYVRQFVQQGYDLIIGHDFMAQDAIFKVAAEYPKLWFAWAGYPVESTNVVPYSVLAQEAAYLTGILAAGMSKTGVIGAMGGFEVPDVVRDIEGFKMGAKAYNPNIKVMVTFTNDWQDPVKGKDTALSLISAGADVIHSDGNPMSLGLFEAAKEKKVYVIGSIGDQYPLSPETVLTSEIYGFPMIFDTIYSGMIKGTLKPEFLGPSLKDGGADLAPYHSFESVIPKELKDRIEQTKQDILSGKLVVPALDKLTN